MDAQATTNCIFQEAEIHMAQERTDVVTFGSKPVTLIGPELKVGDTAPDVQVQANDLSMVSLADFAGKVRLISVVPSLDTGVCDAQTRRFNEEAAGLGDHVAVLTISADLPFAQKRWCGAAGIEQVQVLSDHLGMEFGAAYGTWIKELRLESRAVFVVDTNDKIAYAQYVPAVGSHPDYDSAIAAAKAAQ